jgi:DNA-nicking Smr family endonuclease
MEPIELPIDGVLDLHGFSPKDLPMLISDYLSACQEKKINDLRIIHGKGSGVLKARLRSLLARHPLVLSVTDAPAEAGGWGATLVVLKQK